LIATLFPYTTLFRSSDDGLYVGVGLQNPNSSKQDVIEYVAGQNGKATGIKVFKQGIEAYTLGDFASSTMAGNMRAAYDEQLESRSEEHTSELQSREN